MVAKKESMIPKLNRQGLKTLVSRGYTVSDLSAAFHLSRNWTSRVLFQKINPRHPGIVNWINTETERMLAESA